MCDSHDGCDPESGLMHSSTGQRHKNSDYRVLAISSIICGLSCIGILSLINSVKARAINKGQLRVDGEKTGKKYSKKARNYGILAIVLWLVLLALLPLLLGLLSYILTFID
ncbi:transmembrane protein 265-like [Hoplias malabaricus]|uniref:transmembrane protein 265-like n=1 Tax=Hoplias malabaricus TaxID=27720 RepID=UPI00346246DE